jgi:hypothetical protein
MRGDENESAFSILSGAEFSTRFAKSRDEKGIDRLIECEQFPMNNHAEGLGVFRGENLR